MRRTVGPLLVALTALSCGSDGPTTPAAPPKVLPQAPTSCTFRVDRPYFDDRVGWFAYDIRWFPPEQQGSDPVTSYEVDVVREALKGTLNADGVLEISSSRNLPAAKQTVRAKTGTTNDVHSIADVATFPVCEMLARGEDLGFRATVRARSAAGWSLPFTCVDAHRLWDGIVWTIANNTTGYWHSWCNAAATGPVENAGEWVAGIAH